VEISKAPDTLRQLKELGLSNAEVIECLINETTAAQVKKVSMLLGKDKVFDFNLANRINIYHLIDYAGKNNIYKLNNQEKRNLLDVLLKMDMTDTTSLKEYFPLIPTEDIEYTLLVNKLSTHLNIQKEKLPKEKLDKFNSTMMKFSTNFADIDISELTKINLEYSHQNFVSDFNNITENLPKDEVAKLEAYFGFNIQDGKIIGYPKTGNDLKMFDITNENTIEKIEKLSSIVTKFTDNNVLTVKDNPELNNLLKELSTTMPEIYNQIGGSENFINTLKTLQKITKNPNFSKLNDNDKKTLTLATLLHNTNPTLGSRKESAIDGLFISQKFGLSQNDQNKLFHIIESSNLVREILDTKKELKTFDSIQYSTKQRAVDFIAFKLSNENTFDMARMLYTAKVRPELTRHFDKLLAEKVNEIKSENFILPQTNAQTMMEYATSTNIKGHQVLIVDSSKIPDFYAYIHTPEASFATKTSSSRNKKIANFEIFRQLGDEKVICTSYVGNGKTGAANNHGVIVNIDADKSYVGYGHDIFSLAKNQQDMVVEYLHSNGAKASSGKGLKSEHRSFISSKLKEILKINDSEYIARLDNIKAKLDSKAGSLEEIEKIDKEFAEAYREFLKIDNSGDDRNNIGLLRNDYWNEILVSNPQVTAYYTKDFNNLPDEYLELAEKNNIPIVILK